MFTWKHRIWQMALAFPLALLFGMLVTLPFVVMYALTPVRAGMTMGPIHIPPIFLAASFVGLMAFIPIGYARGRRTDLLAIHEAMQLRPQPSHRFYADDASTNPPSKLLGVLAALIGTVIAAHPVGLVLVAFLQKPAIADAAGPNAGGGSSPLLIMYYSFTFVLPAILYFAAAASTFFRPKNARPLHLLLALPFAVFFATAFGSVIWQIVFQLLVGQPTFNFPQFGRWGHPQSLGGVLPPLALMIAIPYCCLAIRDAWRVYKRFKQHNRAENGRETVHISP